MSMLYLISVPLLLRKEAPGGFFAGAGPRFDFKVGSRTGVVEYEWEGITFREGDRLGEISETYVPGWSVAAGHRCVSFSKNTAL